MLFTSWVTMDLTGQPVSFTCRWETPEGWTRQHVEHLDEGCTLEEVDVCIAAVERIVKGGWRDDIGSIVVG